MKKFDTRTMLILAMLVACEIVLSRFLSFNAWNVKIGFSFVPIVVAAILFGPIHAGIVGALGDFLGATLFPIGAYFPGFTLTAFLTGVVFGLFLHNEQTVVKTIAAAGLNQFILGLFLNTLWISMLYGSPYGPLLATRVFQALLLFAVQFIVVQVLAKATPRLKKELDNMD